MSLEDAILRRSERIQNIKQECAYVFENSKSITLEIGCGKGHYMSAYAAAFPEETCIGIDLISERVRDSQRRAQRGRVCRKRRAAPRHHRLSNDTRATGRLRASEASQPCRTSSRRAARCHSRGRHELHQYWSDIQISRRTRH